MHFSSPFSCLCVHTQITVSKSRVKSLLCAHGTFPAHSLGVSEGTFLKGCYSPGTLQWPVKVQLMRYLHPAPCVRTHRGSWVRYSSFFMPSTWIPVLLNLQINGPKRLNLFNSSCVFVQIWLWSLWEGELKLLPNFQSLKDTDTWAYATYSLS